MEKSNSGIPHISMDEEIWLLRNGIKVRDANLPFTSSPVFGYIHNLVSGMVDNWSRPVYLADDNVMGGI
jgi:hypothetical protein